MNFIVFCIKGAIFGFLWAEEVLADEREEAGAATLTTSASTAPLAPLWLAEASKGLTPPFDLVMLSITAIFPFLFGIC